MDERETKEAIKKVMGNLEETLKGFYELIDEITEMDDPTQKIAAAQIVNISICVVLGAIRSGYHEPLRKMMVGLAKEMKKRMTTVPKGINLQ